MDVTLNPTFTQVGSMEVGIFENGYALCDADWKQTRVHIPFSRLFYVISGEGDVWSDTEQITLRPGNLYFVPFDCVISTDCQTRLEKLYFHVTVPFLGKLDIFEGFDRLLTLPADNIAEMVALYTHPTVANLVKLKAGIYADIARIVDLMPLFNQSAQPLNHTVTEALAYIDTHLSSRLRVSEVAAHVFVSESRLSRLFRQELGVTVGEYVNNRLTVEIERCIMLTELTADEICERFSFCDVSYFIRFFKRQIGMTPLQYKKTVTRKTFSTKPIGE